MDEIAPRHFVQTAEMSGVGASVVEAIFADLGAQAERPAAKVAAALPPGFPGRLVDSAMAAIARRARLLAG